MLLALGLTGCACGDKVTGALRVEVLVQGFSPGCIEVSATDSDGSTPELAALTVDRSEARTTFNFGVARKAGWGPFVDLEIRARATDCAGAILATASEARIELPDGEVVARSYTLTLPPCTASSSCSLPPSECFEGQGACLGDGGCAYAVRAGVACNDGDACSASDVCDAAGSCAGSAISCIAAGTCELPGACVAGQCVYPAASGAGCNDGVSCTAADVCGANKVCAGAAYTCDLPPECMRTDALSCLGDGGCAYFADPARNGQPCDGGTCASGTCQPAGSGSSFVPTNFDPAATPAGGNVLLNCAVSFDSSDGGVTGNWCGGPAPSIYAITQLTGGAPATVLAMRGLSITDAGTLRLLGSRPVILWVDDAGVTTIDGVIDARGVGTQPGAGGDRGGCGPQTGADGGRTVSGGFNVGSGGGGAGFATRGADGGWADFLNFAGGAGGAAGPASLTPLVGGCAGGNGGFGNGVGGEGGAGGGGLQLSVRGTLRLGPSAVLSVSGGGGRGGIDNQASGGGGGASGGGLVLEAARLLIGAGVLTANGGAGGEGSDNGASGNPGGDGAAASATPAPGGFGNALFAAAGGNGAAGVTGPTISTQSNYVGGGGGGSVGRIELRASLDGGCAFDGGAVVSPPHAASGSCR